MNINYCTRILTSFVLVFGINSVSVSFAADDYFQSASTITSTRARQSQDQGYVKRQKSWINPFSKPETKEPELASVPDMKRASIAYPTGSVSSSSLLLEKMYPSVVRTGTPYEYIIKVTNLTNLSLNDVRISEVIPAGFEIIGAEPMITDRAGDSANWSLGTLAPNDMQTITVKGKANSNQDLPCCTSADYGLPALCSETSVVQPAIALSMETRPEATVCDRIPLQYTVKNTGDSLLTGVMLKSVLPAGMSTLDGGKEISLSAGSLSAGESKVLTAYAKAQKTGKFKFDGRASSQDISASASTESLQITQPKFTLDVKADRAKQYVGRTVGYGITVKNSGDSQATSVVLEGSVPATARIQDADKGGQVSGRTVRWDLGTIAKGATQTLNMSVQGLSAGETLATAQIKAVCAAPVEKMASAKFEGIPALLLEVIDVADPIAVGEEETYIIKVTNQGTADATNIKITAILEDMTYVSGTGITPG
ncbi:MAG: DUF11 domain-containing protein, partial [Candidatus Omnitrophica bacterium]|nr:DUF11 domain-containing protein [Candidatus Omnitrophota bacterium]